MAVANQQPPTQTNAPVAPVSYGIPSNKSPPIPTISLLKTAIAPISVEGLRIQGKI